MYVVKLECGPAATGHGIQPRRCAAFVNRSVFRDATPKMNRRLAVGKQALLDIFFYATPLIVDVFPRNVASNFSLSP
jgi:hypothetical protein